MTFITNKNERSRFLKFALVGVIGTIVDFTFFNIFRSLGISVQFAGGIAFSIAVINNFLLNRFWIYPDAREKSFLNQFASFVVINIVGLGIRVGILSFLPNWIESFLVWTNIKFPIVGLEIKFFAENSSVAISIGIVMFWNYFINRYWTFNDIDKMAEKMENEA